MLLKGSGGKPPMASLGTGGGGGGGGGAVGAGVGCSLEVNLDMENGLGKVKKYPLIFLSSVVGTTFALAHIFILGCVGGWCVRVGVWRGHPCLVTKRVPIDMVCISWKSSLAAYGMRSSLKCDVFLQGLHMKMFDSGLATPMNPHFLHTNTR